MLHALGNARVVADAEAYHRASYRGGREGWNLGNMRWDPSLGTVWQLG